MVLSPCCLILALGWQWRWRPALAHLEAQRSRLASRLEVHAQDAEQLRALPAARLARQALAAQLRQIDGERLDAGDVKPLLAAIAESAARHGLVRTAFVPQAVGREDDMPVLTLQLRAEGRYRDIADWLSDLARLPWLLTLPRLRLHAEGGQSRLGLDATAIVPLRASTEGLAQPEADPFLAPDADAAPVPAPSVQLLGTLATRERRYGVVRCGEEVRWVQAGDTLPAGIGRVLRIDDGGIVWQETGAQAAVKVLAIHEGDPA